MCRTAVEAPNVTGFMELVYFSPVGSQIWKPSKKSKKTPPISRLRKILDTEDDIFPDAYGSSFVYFCEMSEDYEVFVAMLGHEYSCSHIAFRYATDWSVKKKSTEYDVTVCLPDPDVILTSFGAWLFWMCYVASEKIFASEVILCREEDYEFEPRAA